MAEKAVISVKAGIHRLDRKTARHWIAASAGMTIVDITAQ